MKQEWITQYNKKCAEFMGGVYDSDATRYWFYLPVKWDEVFAPTTNDLKFHSDWNWIMEVLCKIEEIHHTVISQGITGHYININRKDVDIVTETLDNPSKFMGVGKTKKEAVIRAIDQFIDWYNKQKEL